MGDFDACRFDFRLDSKNGLMPSKRKKTERIQPSNYSTLFKCKICGTLFSCRTTLLEHKMTHAEYRSNRSKYECSVCTGEKATRFSRKDQLREHLSRDHKLDDAQVVLLVGGRNSSVARKPRGSNPRKGTELPPKKSTVKKTALESSTVDRKDSLDGVAAQASNPGLPRLEPIRSQGQSAADQLSPGALNPASSYLYINFPILLSPQTSVPGASGDRPDRLITTGIPWPNTPPCTPTSTTAPKLNNTETDKVTNSQCGLMISPSELATTFDLRNAQLRDWLVARTVAASAASGESGTVRQSPLLFGLSADSPGKRELSGSMVLKELARGLGKNDDQGVLDFSLKARLAPFEVPDDSLRSRPTFSRHTSIDSDVEVADVVDLSWKGVRLSGRNALRAAVKGRTGLERKMDGVKQSNDEASTPSNHYRGDSGTKLGVNYTGVALGVSADECLGTYYAGANAADLIGGGVGSALGSGMVSEGRSQHKRPSSESTSTLSRVFSSSGAPAVHSSMPQISLRRGKSGLSKMVEKLWKNKIGQMSDKPQEKSDRMMTCGCEPESVGMEDYDMEASALTDTQDDIIGESDYQLRAADQFESFRDSWIGLNGFPKGLDEVEQDVVQSSMLAYTQETNIDDRIEDIVRVAEEEEGEYETEWIENDVIDLTISSSTRRSATPQQDDYVPSQPTWNNLDDGGVGSSYWKLRSPSTWISGTPPCIDSPPQDAPLSVSEALRECIESRSSLYPSNATQIRTTDQTFSSESQSRCQDYLWEHLLTDRQPRTGYGSPASDPGCGGGSSVVKPHHLVDRDAAVVLESGSHRLSTLSGSSSPTRDQRLSCGYPNCGKTFKEWRHLKVHLTLHTGEKPLSCYLCRYSCRHRSSMNWHMKSKHRLEKSKTSGNRTVYVDAARSGSMAPHGASTEVMEMEEALENVPSPLLDEKKELESETCCYPPPQPGTVYLIEPEGEVFLTERKNETLLRELRLSLNILKNGPGPEVRQPPTPEVLSLTGSGNDVAIIQRSSTKDEKPIVVTDRCHSRVSGLVAPGCASTSFKDRFVEGPELLLKKITPAPGKDPQFYTSLMRMKYTKHPSSARRPRRPVKRKPVPVQRVEDVVAVHRCVTCDRVFDGADALWLHGLSEHEDVVRGGVSCCEWCGFESGSNTELQCHLLSNHGKEMGNLKEDHQSSICGHECPSMTGLNHHLLHQHENNEVSHQYLSCPDPGCGDMTNQGTVKQHHLLCAHLGPTLPPTGDVGCGQCGASDGEVSLSHSPLGGPPLITPLGQADERPVTCDYPGCDKSFRELKHLKVHQMQHTDEKPLRCHLCEYSCRQRNSMNWHMKSKHGQDKHVTSDGRTIYI